MHRMICLIRLVGCALLIWLANSAAAPQGPPAYAGSDACKTCHADVWFNFYKNADFTRANIRRSEHTLHDIACTNCHSNHHPATPKNLLAKNQAELCYGCHADVRAQFSMPFKHRVNEGLIQCTDCHNPHGTFAPT